jgi:hypothetical protein
VLHQVGFIGSLAGGVAERVAEQFVRAVHQKMMMSGRQCYMLLSICTGCCNDTLVLEMPFLGV